MRGYRFGAIGLGLLAAAAPAAAPAAAQAPAARLRILADNTPAARGQIPDPKIPAPNLAPAPATQLGQPRPFGPGPSVLEQRVPAPQAAPGGTIPNPGTAFNPYPVVGGSFDPAVGYPGTPVPVGDYGGYDGLGVDVEAPLLSPNAGQIGTLPATSAQNKWYASAEYLLWWVRSGKTPPLVTAGPVSSNGILGNAGTQVLFGDTTNNTMHNGGRFGAGYWFGCDQRWGLDGSGFFLARQGSSFSANTGSYPLLARPFTNLNSGVPFSEVVGATGLADGYVDVRTATQMWGAEANVRRYLAKTNCARLDLIAGFRYISLDEDLSVNEYFRRTPDSQLGIGVPTAVSGNVYDTFRTENKFYGGQVGLLGEARRGRWFLNGSGKIALGKVYQTATIAGGQTINFNDGTTRSFGGGLLALPNANIGVFKQDKFAVVPEVGLNIGYHLTPHCRIYVGYTFLYMNSVLRPGDQIDTGLDVTRIPNFPVANVAGLSGAVRPSPTLRETDFFAQGINFGLQLTW